MFVHATDESDDLTNSGMRAQVSCEWQKSFYE